MKGQHSITAAPELGHSAAHSHAQHAALQTQSASHAASLSTPSDAIEPADSNAAATATATVTDAVSSAAVTDAVTDAAVTDTPADQTPQLAAIRTAQHNEDSHLLEGVQFSALEMNAPSTNLQPVDLCTILALCLDVQNSNPRDGLTNEQMSPYVDRVLRTPSNWMIYR